jgi:formamidopyrimidine-DNA glycosylase
MPELPAVERGRRLAEQALVGRRIERVATVHDAIVYTGVSPRRFASALRGRRVLAACRWGKFIWLELDRRPWPVFHFGMTGSFQVYEDARHRPPFWKVELQMETGQRLAMCNKRRLGRIRLQTDPRHEPPIRRLGFDALLDEPAFATFADGLRRRHAAIKAVLLDQTFAAGVGNWIADEVLYQARIAPHRLANGLTANEVRRLRNRLRTVVRKAVDVNADSGRFPKTWLFHRRWKRNSHATTIRGDRIVHVRIGGRTTAWVPGWQR